MDGDSAHEPKGTVAAMIGLSTTAKDEMLAIFAGRVFSLGLFIGDSEIIDRMYARQAIAFSAPLGEDTRYVQNTEIIRFEGFNQSHHADAWGVFDGEQIKAVYRLTKPLDVGPEMDCKFRAGELRIGLP